MAVLEEGAKKEQTILELSEGLGTELRDLRARLDHYFDRKIATDCEGREKPQQPNVLDEIIETLEEDLGVLRRMSSFVVNEVLPKIK